MTQRRRVVATINSQHPATQYRLGGDRLVEIDDETGEFYVLTGPTPWGTGIWGAFPVDAITATREPMPTDSWPVSGCPSERWTVAQLDVAIQRASRW